MKNIFVRILVFLCLMSIVIYKTNENEIIDYINHIKIKANTETSKDKAQSKENIEEYASVAINENKYFIKKGKEIKSANSEEEILKIVKSVDNTYQKAISCSESEFTKKMMHNHCLFLKKTAYEQIINIIGVEILKESEATGKPNIDLILNKIDKMTSYFDKLIEMCEHDDEKKAYEEVKEKTLAAKKEYLARLQKADNNEIDDTYTKEATEMTKQVKKKYGRGKNDDVINTEKVLFIKSDKTEDNLWIKDKNDQLKRVSEYDYFKFLIIEIAIGKDDTNVIIKNFYPDPGAGDINPKIALINVDTDETFIIPTRLTKTNRNAVYDFYCHRRIPAGKYEIMLRNDKPKEDGSYHVVLMNVFFVDLSKDYDNAAVCNWYYAAKNTTKIFKVAKYVKDFDLDGLDDKNIAVYHTRFYEIAEVYREVYSRSDRNVELIREKLNNGIISKEESEKALMANTMKMSWEKNNASRAVAILGKKMKEYNQKLEESYLKLKKGDKDTDKIIDEAIKEIRILNKSIDVQMKNFSHVL